MAGGLSDRLMTFLIYSLINHNHPNKCLYNNRLTLLLAEICSNEQ